MSSCDHAACPPIPTPPRRIRLLEALKQMRSLARQRRDLGNLSAEQRADIGITRAEAANETARPVWDAPFHWRR